jgi:hypothetical protein
LRYVPGRWLIWVANEMFGQSLRISKLTLVVKRGNWKEVETILGAWPSDCKTEASRRHIQTDSGIYETTSKQSLFNDSLR